MAKTDNFKSQHKEIAEAVSGIERLLNPGALAQNAAEVTKLLILLSGKIAFHLGMEDKYLYPALQNSNDSNLKTLADEYIRDMGTLAKTFKDYVSAWSLPRSIQEKPEEFVKQTKTVFTALRQRIDREETKLYPLADKL